MFIAGCARSLPIFDTPAQPDTSLRSPRTLTPPDFGPWPPRVQGFPAQLDDAALGPMYERRQGFAFSAFFSEFERSGAMYFSDLMDHQRLPATHHERTSIGRLEYEVDAHYLRWQADTPETATTLLALLHAAEASPLYDWELAAHLWQHARRIEPAPLEVFERLDHHFRVVRALHLGAAITGPVTRDYKADVTEVPAGLAAAAASAYPDADAGSFDSYGGLPLTVVEGRVVLIHRGVERSVLAGESFQLRRLDVLRAPGEAILRHEVLGEIAVRSGSEMTAWNFPRFLVPAQRAQVARRVVAMRAGDRQARATVEAMLPAAHLVLHEYYDQTPDDAGDSNAYEIMHVFDGHRAPQ